MSTKKGNKVVQIGLSTEKPTEEQKILFDSTWNNMSECGKKGNGKYTASIPVSLLRIDTSYQRVSTRTKSRLRRLANFWNEDKLTPISVVPHPEEYSFYIVDGYGRFIVSTTMLAEKYTSLDAIVLTKVPQDFRERQKFEAELFIGQYTETERVTPIQMHNARLLVGDGAAIDLQEILDKYHVSYVSTSGQRDKAILGSYQTTYDISKRNGKKCLEFIFSIIDNAGWRNEVNGYSAIIVKSLKDIWCAYSTPELHNKMHTYFSDVLRETDPRGMVAKSKARYSERSDKIMVSLYLADMLMDDLGFEKSKYFEEPTKNPKKVG